MINLKRIISGGQTGADRAGWIAAKKLGIPTGGTMPQGFRALDGYRPEFKELYGAQESISYHYKARTAQNVKDSDGTVRFAGNFFSPGERCTHKYLVALNRPYLDVHVFEIENMDSRYKLHIQKFREFLTKNNIEVLNVAGNSENTCPGITGIVVNFLVDALSSERNNV